MSALASVEWATEDLELATEVSKYYSDPRGFVYFAYPWGERGTILERHEGPDAWQEEFLSELGEEVSKRKFDGHTAVEPIKMSIASGHGIGKSALCAWLTDWIMSTRPDSAGTITANTFPQLQTKTWARIQQWTRMCITSHWFTVSGSRMVAKLAPETWHCEPLTCKAENAEAFQGQHAPHGTSFYIYDESSAIPDQIIAAADFGMTDGEPMVFLFGNPTRQSGKFYQSIFGKDRSEFHYHRSINSQDCRLPNKAMIQGWIDKYGEDSDYVRVRVLGLPPTASELQYIDSTRIEGAKEREVEVLPDEPLVVGFDASGGGEAWNVFRFRRGRDARSIPPVRISGQVGRDRNILITKGAEILTTEYDFPDGTKRKPDALFVDSAFGAPVAQGLVDRGYRNVFEVSFGSESPEPQHDANYRAYMWRQGKDWLPGGAIDPEDDKLDDDLKAPGYHINNKNKLVIESKKDMAARGEPSPDDGDAHVLTFAQKIAPKAPAEEDYSGLEGSDTGWMAG